MKSNIPLGKVKLEFAYTHSNLHRLLETLRYANTPYACFLRHNFFMTIRSTVNITNQGKKYAEAFTTSDIPLDSSSENLDSDAEIGAQNDLPP
jgi:hypothetical protein